MKKRNISPLKVLGHYLHRYHLHITTFFVKILIYPFFYGKFHMSYQGKKDLPKGPYIMLADHVSYLDPFLISLGMARPIRWIAADGNFRNPLMRFLMIWLAGSIAKTKNHSDMQTLAEMKMVAQTGGVIGLFPEGEMSWDGVAQSMFQGTDKLIRFLKIPVVYCHMEGVYLSRPRWSPKARPRPVNLRYETIISAEQVKTIKLPEIRKRIESSITYDDLALQERDPQPLKGGNPALGLERVFFTCPSCKKINTLHTEADRIYCEDCSWQMTMDPLGRPAEGLLHDSLHQWNLWQQQLLYKNLQEGAGVDEPFWGDKGLLLYRGKPKRRARKILEGEARFYRDRILLKGRNEDLVLPLKDITGLNVFKAHYVEFLYKKMQYRMDFQAIPTSGMKWEILYRMLMNQWIDRGDVSK